MLPEILDEKPKNNTYSDNPRMRFLECVIVVLNLLMLVNYIFFKDLKNGELAFFSSCFLFPIFHVFWWNWLTKLYKQGFDINLNGFFFFIQRFVMLLMGTFYSLGGILGLILAVPRRQPIPSQNFLDNRFPIYLLLFFLISGISYLYHQLLVNEVINECTD